MTELTIEIPDSLLHTDTENDGLAQAILTSAAFQLYQAGKLSSQRAAKLAKLSHVKFVRESGTEVPTKLSQPPAPMETLRGSRYLARILWALREGEKISLTPMTAADIAHFITSHSSIKVQQTNTARFFRECRDNGRFEEYWTAFDDGPRRRYALTDTGRELLESSLSVV